MFKSTFKALINEEYSIGIYIERYQKGLEHALSKVAFLVGIGSDVPKAVISAV